MLFGFVGGGQQILRQLGEHNILCPAGRTSRKHRSCLQHARSWQCPSYPMTNSRHAQPMCRAHRHAGPRGDTPRTRPPAPPPLGRWPKAEWTTHDSPRALVPAPPSIKRTSSSNPDGPLRGGCRRPAPPSTSGFLYPGPGTLDATSAPRAWSVSSIQPWPPAPAMDTHCSSCPV